MEIISCSLFISGIMISLINAEPAAVRRYETTTGWPWVFLPSQEPESDLSISKDFSELGSATAARAVSNMAKETAVRRVFILFLFEKLFGFGLTSSFFGVFGFYKGFQVRKIGLPEHSILLQPLVHSLERFSTELINPIAPLTPF